MGGPGEGVGGPGARRGEGPFRPDVVRKRLRCSGASFALRGGGEGRDGGLSHII